MINNIKAQKTQENTVSKADQFHQRLRKKGHNEEGLSKLAHCQNFYSLLTYSIY